MHLASSPPWQLLYIGNVNLYWLVLLLRAVFKHKNGSKISLVVQAVPVIGKVSRKDNFDNSSEAKSTLVLTIRLVL